MGEQKPTFSTPVRAANKESASSDSSSRGFLEDEAGDDMVLQFIRKFSMTTTEGC